MSKRIKPAIGEIYHIYNRGVEKRDVFLDDHDRKRFMYNLFIFNDYRLVINVNRMMEVRLPSIDEREKMVEILAFCLMPNHFHILLKQITENGTTEFLRKLGTGYTNYFNLKYKRVGPLFQGKYKCALIKDDKHFMYLPHYIHLNPVGISVQKMREKNVKNLKQIEDFLKSYRWSSYLDYIGKTNVPEILDKQFLDELFRGPEHYQKSIVQWLKDGDIEYLNDIALEHIN
ncbi:MAG: transposase [Patescibacteria group bacterium]